MFYRDNDDEQPDELRDTHLKLYRGVLSLVPNFKKTIEGFGDNYESIMELIDLVRRIPIPPFLLRAAIDGERIQERTTTRHVQDEGRHTRVFCL